MIGFKNSDGLDLEGVRRELAKGARFVVYRYAVSFVCFTRWRKSEIYLVRKGDCAVRLGKEYNLKTATLGWWALPWGPVLSISCLIENLRGGKDVTAQVLKANPELIAPGRLAFAA